MLEIAEVELTGVETFVGPNGTRRAGGKLIVEFMRGPGRAGHRVEIIAASDIQIDWPFPAVERALLDAASEAMTLLAGTPVQRMLELLERTRQETADVMFPPDREDPE